MDQPQVMFTMMCLWVGEQYVKRLLPGNQITRPLYDDPYVGQIIAHFKTWKVGERAFNWMKPAIHEKLFPLVEFEPQAQSFKEMRYAACTV